jgi:hypothetical protein
MGFCLSRVMILGSFLLLGSFLQASEDSFRGEIFSQFLKLQRDLKELQDSAPARCIRTCWLSTKEGDLEKELNKIDQTERDNLEDNTLVQRCLEGYEIFNRNREKFPPQFLEGLGVLLDAVRRRNSVRIHRLLRSGTLDVDGTCEGWTALHLAAQFGYDEVTMGLLLYGADSGLVNDDGKTALDLCCENQQNVANGHDLEYEKTANNLRRFATDNRPDTE